MGHLSVGVHYWVLIVHVFSWSWPLTCKIKLRCFLLSSYDIIPIFNWRLNRKLSRTNLISKHDEPGTPVTRVGPQNADWQIEVALFDATLRKMSFEVPNDWYKWKCWHKRAKKFKNANLRNSKWRHQGWGRLLWKVIDYDYNYMALKK